MIDLRKIWLDPPDPRLLPLAEAAVRAWLQRHESDVLAHCINSNGPNSADVIKFSGLPDEIINRRTPHLARGTGHEEHGTI